MTTKPEVLAMAIKAGFTPFNDDEIPPLVCNEKDIQRFAALVAAAEREECAKDKVDAERYRWLCADMPGSDEADARYRVLQRMDMMGKGAIDSEIDNWRIK